jgi:signal recognition particle receptor subunit beta
MDINYGTGEVNFKIVYYGPGLSGKTTNLEVLHKKVPNNQRGRLTTIATQQDRTLFFDFMPIELGKINGLKAKLRLFTVPGQVFYNATRKLVLQRADGVVFVADSQAQKMEENLESLHNLEQNLKEECHMSITSLPLVLQFNKRDMPNILSMEELNAKLNAQLKAPVFPAVAVLGEGVFSTLKAVTELVLKGTESIVKGTPRAGKSKTGAVPSLPPRYSSVGKGAPGQETPPKNPDKSKS